MPITLGTHITGDFSNATVANRVMFQTNAANDFTVVRAIPSGTGNYAEFSVGNNSNQAATTSTFLMSVSTTESRISSSIANGGAFLPMTFLTGGAERMRIDTSGNVGIGSAAQYSSKLLLANGAATQVSLGIWNPGQGTGQIGFLASGSSFHIRNCYADGLLANGKGVEIDANGVFGYGTGAGGTVTQATSKSTAVTLNKPCGRITMNNAALAAGETVSFNIVNSVVKTTDLVIVNVEWNASANPIAYSVRAASYAIADGTVLVVVKNETGGSLSDAVVIKFAVIKGASS